MPEWSRLDKLKIVNVMNHYLRYIFLIRYLDAYILQINQIIHDFGNIWYEKYIRKKKFNFCLFLFVCIFSQSEKENVGNEGKNKDLGFWINILLFFFLSGISLTWANSDTVPFLHFQKSYIFWLVLGGMYIYIPKRTQKEASLRITELKAEGSLIIEEVSKNKSDLQGKANLG